MPVDPIRPVAPTAPLLQHGPFGEAYERNGPEAAWAAHEPPRRAADRPAPKPAAPHAETWGELFTLEGPDGPVDVVIGPLGPQG